LGGDTTSEASLADDLANDLDDMDDEYAQARQSTARPARPSSIPAYHIAVRELHQDLVQRLLPPELGRPVLGTLSVIATRQPILQSEVIHIRGKRAYSHIRDLLTHRLILRKPTEGTYRIQTTQEFRRRYRLDPAAVQRTRSLKKHKQSTEADSETPLSSSADLGGNGDPQKANPRGDALPLGLASLGQEVVV
jgi:chromosome segregation and condensation protein ScpB